MTAPRPIGIGLGPRTLLRPLAVSAQGISVQQDFLEAIASNIANAETTGSVAGGAYKRQVAIVERDPVTGELRTRIVEDPTAGRLEYDPGHPDANQDGYVVYPNVDLSSEIVDLMLARRVHEANVSVFQAAKAMLQRAMEI